MTVPPDAKLIYNLPEAKHVTNYLEDYCDNHVYEGKTIRDRMVFNCDVKAITKIDGAWEIKTVVTGEKKTFQCPKLVMASGLYTLPNIPNLPGVDQFAGKVIHQKDFGTSKILDDDKVKNVIVMGGGKSAGDMVYASLKVGKTVSWLLREGGSGTAAFSEPKGIMGYRNAPEIASTRLISLFTPSIYTPQTLFARFCHGTAYGRSLMRYIFSTTDKGTLAYGNFNAREGAREGFHKLASNPEYVMIIIRLSSMLTSHSYFWLNHFVGMAQHADFWQQIAENVDVHRSDILDISGNTVKLRDGTKVSVDAILLGTGFNRSFTLFQSPTAADLGLPVSKDSIQRDEVDWDALEKAADNDIIYQFPALANPPSPRETDTTPYRLYNLMAPFKDDSVVFLGYLGVLNAFYTAECQAIWATAHLDKKIVRPDLDQQRKDTAQMNAFSKRRYPFLGYDGASINYDMIGYCERLLGEVGLKSHIQKTWREYWFGICNAASLKDTTQEYIDLHGDRGSNEGV